MNITWAICVLWLKKIGLFFKNYGAIIGLGLSLLVSLLFIKNKQDAYNNLLKQMQDQITQHHQEIDSLTKNHEAEVARYADIEKRYNDTLKAIATEHQQALDKLDSQKKAELKKIITETKDDPNAQAARIATLLGIPIYVPPSTPSASN